MPRLLLAILFVVPSSLRAQAQCTAAPAPCSTPAGALQITITIAGTYELSLSSNTTTLAAPTAAAYDAGFAASTGPTATIRSNAPWTLSISSSTATWSAMSTEAEPARTDKPASDLGWSTSATGVFTDLSTTSVQVASGARTLSSSVSLYYRTRYSWSLDTPGAYSLPVVFTIVAP